MKPIEIKKDNRYRKGNVVKKSGKLVGNADTVKIATINDPVNPYKFYYVVGAEMAEMIKKEWGW